MEQNNIIVIKNYTKKFGKFVSLHNISFNISQGSIHGFIGPNGSGKTTTIKSIIGAYKSKPGDITVDGYKPGSQKANAQIGYIPEKASFPNHLNTLDYLTTMATLNGIKIKDAKQKALQILGDLKLEKHKFRNPNNFSSGMKKKIMLAQALMNDPKILVLDEPAANLDPTARKELFDSIIKLRNQGITVFISSHVLSELERIVDEITFIYDGNILFTGKTDIFQGKENDLYLKTTNNQYFKDYFSERYNLTIAGDVKSEIVIRKVNSQLMHDIIFIIISSKYELISLRHNDLQSFYDTLISSHKQKEGE